MYLYMYNYPLIYLPLSFNLSLPPSLPPSLHPFLWLFPFSFLSVATHSVSAGVHVHCMCVPSTAWCYKGRGWPMTHALATVHTAHQLLWGHLYCEVSHVFVHTQYMCSCTGHCAVYSHVHAHCMCTCTHVGVCVYVCVCYIT